MSVELLPGAQCTPEVLMHMCLQNMSDTTGVIVLKIDGHGAVDICMSRISLRDLAYASLQLQIHTVETVSGDLPDGTDLIVPPGAA